MPFKVRCRLIAFMGDEGTYPCHFGYKVGDEFIYDGEKFIGEVCVGVLTTMVPAIKFIHDVGNKGCERVAYRYAGHSRLDPGMKQYDGVGFAPVKEVKGQEGKREAPSVKGWPFVCGDSKTSALFVAEPFDLASGRLDLPYYRRQMSLLEKVRNEPGIRTDAVISRFSDWERDEIFPPLTPVLVKILLDELAEVGYIEIREGKIYPGERDPVSECPGTSCR